MSWRSWILVLCLRCTLTPRCGTTLSPRSRLLPASWLPASANAQCQRVQRQRALRGIVQDETHNSLNSRSSLRQSTQELPRARSPPPRLKDNSNQDQDAFFVQTREDLEDGTQGVRPTRRDHCGGGQTAHTREAPELLAGGEMCQRREMRWIWLMDDELMRRAVKGKEEE